jgi:predicted nucleic acid-binding protein
MAVKYIYSNLVINGDVTADTFNDLAINTTSTNNVANQIVRTDVNGYARFGWIRSTSGATTSTITRITASNDEYLRYITPDTFRTQITDPYYAPVASTGNYLLDTTDTFTGILTIEGGRIQFGSYSNQFLGFNTGVAQTTGAGNVGLGFQSTYSLTDGSYNIAVGHQSMYTNVSGQYNTAVGYQSMYQSKADYNTGIGYQSLYPNTTGEYNIGLGHRAGYHIADGTTSNTITNDSIFIGKDSRANANNETNQIVIGDTAIGNGSNTVTLGNSSIVGTYLQGIVRASSMTPAQITSTGNTALITKEYGDANYGGSGGSVTSVSGTGTVSGLTLTGTVTSSGSLTLGGAITGFDNYVSWNLKTGGVQRTTVGSGGNLDLVGGANITTSYSAGGVVTFAGTGDTVYTHPTYNGDDINVDTGALTGATIVSDIDFNITTDSLGHVTDANGVVSTRTLTLADLGFTGDGNANYYVLPTTVPANIFAVNSGNANRLSFWGSADTYSISMGNNQANHGTVTDYSMHHTMGVESGRGFTFGSSRTAVTASINALTGAILSNSTITATGGNSTQWNTAYTHSQSAHDYLPLVGGTLTGELTFQDDNEGITFNGNGRFYKKSGDGLFIRKPSGGQDLKFEDNSGNFIGTFWHSGNDGASSGLNADLLDGQHGSYYYPDSNPDGYTNDQTASEILTAIKTVDGTGSGLDADTVDGFDSTNLIKLNTGVTDLNSISDLYSVFSSAAYASNANGVDWATGIQVAYAGNSGYKKQLMFRSHLFYRSGTSGSWNEVWDSGNDGSGSGLDADLLDGQHGSYYNTGGTVTSINFKTDGTALDVNSNTVTGSGTMIGVWQGASGQYVNGEGNLITFPTIPSLSGYATETYVDDAVSALVDSSPDLLNTLDELAAALGDDENFSTTVTNSIATKLPLAGGTMTGIINMGQNDITNGDSIYMDNWYRSTGDTGWYNSTHGGGIYMNDSTWVRVYNDKKFYVSSTAVNAIHSVGGITAEGNMYASGGNSTEWNTAYTHSQSSHDYLPLTGGTIAGGVVRINTNSNVNTLNISRSGSDVSQVVKIGVTDTTVKFNYIEDTVGEGNGNFGTYVFGLTGNDGETEVIPFVISKTGVTAVNYKATAALYGIETNGLYASVGNELNIFTDNNNKDINITPHGTGKLVVSSDVTAVNGVFSGKLGVAGVTAPASALDVNGVVRASGSSISANGEGAELMYTTTNWWSGSGGLLQAYDRGGSAFKPFGVNGLSLHFSTSGNLKFSIANSGAATFASSVSATDGIFSNDVTLEDNGKAIFGTGGDLEIYHDGSNSYIKDTGTGDFILNATNFRLKNAADSEIYMFVQDGGGVNLYHSGNAVKLQTSSTGIDITGDVSATDGIFSGAVTISGSATVGTYTSASNYHSGADNLILKGNSVGISSIFFQSEKDGVNINHASDYGFIQYHPYGTGTSGEAAELIIGTSNDSDDHVILNPPSLTGIKARIGVSTTDYTVWHAGNDGAGSGLDADLLGGASVSEIESASTIVRRNSSGYLHAQYFNGTGTFNTNGGTSGMGIFTGTNGSDNYGRSYTAGAARTLLNVANGATNVTNNNQITNGAGYTTNVGDITGVTAGTNLTGGGTSGTVTLNVSSTPSFTSVNATSSYSINGVNFAGEISGHIALGDWDGDGLETKIYSDSNVKLETTGAGVTVTGSITADVFYDAQNGGYYLNPSGSSILGSLQLQETTVPIVIKPNSTTKSWIHHIPTSDDYIFAPSTADGNTTWDWGNQVKFSAASVVTAKNFVLMSDRRFKTNIKKLKEKEINVDWKTFNMKSEKEELRYGVIAQQLEKKHPEFVRTDDKGMKSVAYIDLLIAKIAELEARLEKLEK